MTEFGSVTQEGKKHISRGTAASTFQRGGVAVSPKCFGTPTYAESDEIWHVGKYSVFLGRQPRPCSKGPPNHAQRPQIFRISYVHAHSIRNNNLILHDQTRWEANFYTVDCEC